MATRIRLGLVLGVAAVLAACGTRVPDSTFRSLRAEGLGAAPAGGAPATPGGSDAGGAVPDTSTTAPGPQPGAGSASSAHSAAPGTTQPGSPARSTASTAAAAKAANPASDTGVTPTSIKVGNIASASGPLGPDVFMPMEEGANAYFAMLNAQGGVNGRKIQFIHCDDAEDPGRNEECAHSLIDDQKVFALVGNSTRAYSAAGYVSGAGVPDVGGQPIGYEYYRYPTLFAIRGATYKRDGNIGQDGKLYLQTLQFRYFKTHAAVSNVGVVYYNVPQSQTYANFVVSALAAEGMQANRYEVNVAFPNFDTVVADMKARGIDGIWDAMDATGNENLCRAMERGSLSVKAKVETSQGWTRSVKDTVPGVCKQSLYVESESRPNADVSNAGIKQFRDTMTKVYNGRYDNSLHQWALEGWAAAQLFTDGVRSLGANVTRKGLIDWLNSQHDYTGNGLLSPIDWKPIDFSKTKAGRECLVLARWNDQQANFVAATPVPYCEDNVPYIAFTPA